MCHFYTLKPMDVAWTYCFKIFAQILFKSWYCKFVISMMCLKCGRRYFVYEGKGHICKKQIRRNTLPLIMTLFFNFLFIIYLPFSFFSSFIFFPSLFMSLLSKAQQLHDRLSISRFRNENHAKFVWDLFIHRFIPHLSTHLSMCQMCFQHMIFVCKMYEPMHEQTSHDFHY